MPKGTVTKLWHDHNIIGEYCQLLAIYNENICCMLYYKFYYIGKIVKV